MGDHPAPLRASRCIEHSAGGDRALQHRPGHLETGLLAQFAEHAVLHPLLLIEVAARQGNQPLAGMHPAPHHQDMARLHHHRIGGHEGWRIGGNGPELAVVGDVGRLLGKPAVTAALAVIDQEGLHTFW